MQAQKTILATAILQNMATEWLEEDVAGPDDDGSDEEDDAPAPVMAREEPDRAEGNRVWEAMLQARFLSINSKALSIMKTPQHFFYFKFKKVF